MKAILWKELRENGRWALLGGLVLSLAEFYVLADQQQNIDDRGNITLTDATFLMVILFGSALVAVGLAAVQILPERSRDRWAALLHRPVSPGVILAGKVIAGLGLYAAAVGLPFLASVCYVAWPGKFAAPFVPGLLLPGIHDLAGGVAFYFGSLLLCLHRGRWLGTRGALLASLGAVFLLQMDMKGPFLLFPVLAAVVLAFAAWHAMMGDGPAPRGRGPRWFAFVTVVLVGAQTALLLAGAGLDLLPKRKNVFPFAYSDLRVTLEGQVIRLTYGSNGEGLKVTDLAGHPVTDERYTGNRINANLCEFSAVSYSLGRRRRGTHQAEDNGLRGTTHVQGVRLESESRESWFRLVRQNYFVGYDHLSRRCIGICDREGFKAPGAKPVPFESPLRESFRSLGANNWFWTDHRIFAVNFYDRELKPFLDRPDGTIDEAAPLTLDQSSEDFRYAVLAFDDGIQVIDEQGHTLFTRPYLHDPQGWDVLEIATNPAADRLYFLSEPGFFRREQESAPTTTYLDELDLHGTVLHSYHELIDNRIPPGPRWLTTAQACLLPILPSFLLHLHHNTVDSPWSEASTSFERNVLALDRTGWVAMSLVAVVLAAVAFGWARRVGFSVRQAGGWTAFVLAFGLAGLLAFRLAGRWPQRVHCPACGHLRDLDKDACPHCQRAWAAPTPIGTEIFEPLSVRG